MFPIVVLSCLLTALASAACIDKVNNLVYVNDIKHPSLSVHLEGITVGTYDSQGRPVCEGDTAEIKLPGEIKILSGKIKVTGASDVSKLVGKFTLTKNAFLVGTACKEGEGKSSLFPKEYCKFDAMKVISEGLRNLLATPGEYDMETSKVDKTIKIQGVPHSTDRVMKGDWQGDVDFVNGAKILTNVKFPINMKWLYVEP